MDEAKHKVNKQETYIFWRKINIIFGQLHLKIKNIGLNFETLVK